MILSISVALDQVQKRSNLNRWDETHARDKVPYSLWLKLKHLGNCLLLNCAMAFKHITKSQCIFLSLGTGHCASARSSQKYRTSPFFPEIAMTVVIIMVIMAVNIHWMLTMHQTLCLALYKLSLSVYTTAYYVGFMTFINLEEDSKALNS